MADLQCCRTWPSSSDASQSSHVVAARAMQAPPEPARGRIRRLQRLGNQRSRWPRRRCRPSRRHQPAQRQLCRLSVVTNQAARRQLARQHPTRSSQQTCGRSQAGRRRRATGDLTRWPAIRQIQRSAGDEDLALQLSLLEQHERPWQAAPARLPGITPAGASPGDGAAAATSSASTTDTWSAADAWQPAAQQPAWSDAAGGGSYVFAPAEHMQPSAPMRRRRPGAGPERHLGAGASWSSSRACKDGRRRRRTSSSSSRGGDSGGGGGGVQRQRGPPSPSSCRCRRACMSGSRSSLATLPESATACHHHRCPAQVPYAFPGPSSVPNCAFCSHTKQSCSMSLQTEWVLL